MPQCHPQPSCILVCTMTNSIGIPTFVNKQLTHMYEINKDENESCTYLIDLIENMFKYITYQMKMAE